MKRLAAGLITLLALALVLWFGKPGSTPRARGAESPVQCVERMFAAAAGGDVPAYLGCFTGQERQGIERSLAQEPGAPLAASLRATIADLKGWAVLDPPTLAADDTTCRLTVERVYAGRVDRQRMVLRREASGWQIAQVERAEATQPPIAYGTPVYAADPPGAAQPVVPSTTR